MNQLKFDKILISTK